MSAGSRALGYQQPREGHGYEDGLSEWWVHGSASKLVFVISLKTKNASELIRRPLDVALEKKVKARLAILAVGGNYRPVK